MGIADELVDWRDGQMLHCEIDAPNIETWSEPHCNRCGCSLEPAGECKWCGDITPPGEDECSACNWFWRTQKHNLYWAIKGFYGIGGDPAMEHLSDKAAEWAEE